MKVLALIATALILQGCANPMSIYRPLDTASGTGALIDIKQRAIVAGKRPDPTTGTPMNVVCTEPSPDALASYAAELAAKSDKAGAELGAAVREGAAFVGLRTSSIQLLRDQLFYSCLSFMNGAIDKSQYELMSRRYQRQVVALMAIEQLTGAIKAPPVTLSSDNVAMASRAAQQLSKDIASTDAALKQLNDDLTKKPDAEKKPLQDEIDRLTKNRDAMVQGLSNTRDVLAGGSIKVEVSSVGSSTQRTDGHVLAVAETVREIVRDITGINDLPTLCFSALSSAKEETTTPIRGICESYFKATFDEVEARSRDIRKQQAIAEDPTKSPSERALASQEIERLRDQNRRSMEVLSQPRGRAF
ncbi:hypothetical protein [Hydrogenophaga sp.]|uniref:hypothetical protein n=1 Tax=Hydrogenophaga sp. TaxID=1904254 RepID=UPI002ABA1F3E|nr:hypothetical protein [Hydrogenophaga sp.]MDZ4399084.1 hypothetical protein [Hydrogenophaga sp.]